MWRPSVHLHITSEPRNQQHVDELDFGAVLHLVVRRGIALGK
jgi:hypothetical protein